MRVTNPLLARVSSAPVPGHSVADLIAFCRLRRLFDTNCTASNLNEATGVGSKTRSTNCFYLNGLWNSQKRVSLRRGLVSGRWSTSTTTSCTWWAISIQGSEQSSNSERKSGRCWPGRGLSREEQACRRLACRPVSVSDRSPVERGRPYRRRRTASSPANPKASSTTVDGSGM